MDIINVSGELEVIREGNEKNSNVTNRDKPKINFNMLSAKDTTAKNDSETFHSLNKNLSLESQKPLF